MEEKTELKKSISSLRCSALSLMIDVFREVFETDQLKQTNHVKTEPESSDQKQWIVSDEELLEMFIKIDQLIRMLVLVLETIKSRHGKQMIFFPKPEGVEFPKSYKSISELDNKLKPLKKRSHNLKKFK